MIVKRLENPTSYKYKYDFNEEMFKHKHRWSERKQNGPQLQGGPSLH